MNLASIPPIPVDRLRFEETIHPGGMWSHVIKRHTTLRLTDLEGGANVSVLLYNPLFPSERYNMADTLKGQHIARLTKPYCLYSDMGRIFFSITEDTCGWHDTICGVSHAEMTLAQYGEGRFQELRNRFYRNGYDNLLIELEKWGLGRKDLVPNINFFSKVTSEHVDSGRLIFHVGHSKAGDLIDLRAEMDTLVILNTCPHPLDPAPVYSPKRVKVSVFTSEPPAADDPCRLSRPENTRGFINTERYHL